LVYNALGISKRSAKIEKKEFVKQGYPQGSAD